ncbi:MAG: TIGR04255 family protein [Oscillospiraceae bacterium]|nr:TIGR04255 family protein [Oscillospiraceae bacterium]
MFLDTERVRYNRPQLLEVICQLRFPTILSISAREPAEFQELIRGEFPRYSRNIEKLPPKVMGRPGNMKLQEQPEVVNYQFLSADGRWKVNLTNNFVALATPAYTCWEDFAAKLDAVLAQFIAVYNPAYFERIGLRYINAISRKELELEDVPFSDLIQPGYLGLMAEEDVPERSFIRSMQESEVNLPGGCCLKLHCGPGMVKRNNVDDKEIKFILDNDIFMAGKVEMKHSAAALTTVHTHANRAFRGAITQMLHNAMEPGDI